MVENSIVDVVTADCYHRLRWVSPPQIIIKGSSFSCCKITGILAEYIGSHGGWLSHKQALQVLKEHPQAKFMRAKPYVHTSWEEGRVFVKKYTELLCFPLIKKYMR